MKSSLKGTLPKPIIFAAFMVGLVLSLAVQAQAAFEGRLPATPGGTDYQAYYDTHLNITWAADANINGVDTWANQVAWAAGLKIGEVRGWRLPTTTVAKFSDGGDFILLSTPFDPRVQAAGALRRSGISGFIVAKAGSGSGTVTGPGVNCGSDCTTTVNNGGTVTVTASASTGSSFSSWAGCNSTSAFQV